MTTRNDPQTTILVVDDDREIAENLSDYLNRSGYRVDTAPNGAKGLVLLKEKRHHIAIVDFKLPDINGIDLSKSIRACNPRTIIVLISGYATIQAAAEAIQNGAYDFIAKPFDFGELKITLSRAMQKRAQTERLQRLKRRNLFLAASLPLWLLLGYLLVSRLMHP